MINKLLSSVFLLLLISSISPVVAQDSLFLERQIANESTNLINQNIDLSRAEPHSPDFFAINKRQFNAAQQSNNKKLLAITSSNLAVYSFQHNDFKNAQFYTEQAMQSQNELSNPKALALQTARLAYIFDKLNNDDRALDLYKQSIKNFQQLKLDKQLAEANYLISKLYVKINKADDAEQFLRSGIEASQQGSTKALGNKMSNLLQSIDQSKKERNARLLQLLAIESSGFNGMSYVQKGKVCKEIGFNYWGGSEFEKANNYFNKSAGFFASAGEMPDNEEFAADIVSQAGQFKPIDAATMRGASDRYDQIRDSILKRMIVDKHDKGELERALTTGYLNLSKEEIKRLNLSTDDLIKKLIYEKDSLSKSELNYNDEEIAAKENLIKQLLKEKELQALALKAKLLEIAQAKYFKYWMMAAAGLIFLIAIFIFIIYRNNQRSLIKTKRAYKELTETHLKLKTTQQQLVQSEKMAGLGQLTAGVAHEINNPINFVSSSIGSLKRDVDDLKLLLKTYQEKPAEAPALAKELDINYTVIEIDELMKGITEGANRTSEIVKGLRNFSRTDEAEKKNANINDCLESTIMILQTKLKDKNIDLKKSFASLPEIACYPGQLNQVFMNIIGNAADAIESKNGEIIVTTKNENNNILVSIKDNGKGMSAEVKQKIFDPFFTTKDVGSGTGLGLSIAYGIMEKHHANIDVQSELGKGTEFVITIPFA
jgi:signal transduction histidine kinase